MLFIGNVKQVCVRVYVYVLVSFRICAQNVRMIYFHIWFVCASSSNVIHIKWNFFFLLVSVYFSPATPFSVRFIPFFLPNTIRYNEIVYSFSGSHSYSYFSVFFFSFISSHWNCLSASVLRALPFALHARSSALQRTRTTDIRRNKVSLLFHLFTIVELPFGDVFFCDKKF